MTGVHLTAAQARALGLGGGAPGQGPKEARPRRTRHQVPRARAVSTCHTCGATFDTDAAETRHVADTLHARYETEIT